MIAGSIDFLKETSTGRIVSKSFICFLSSNCKKVPYFRRFCTPESLHSKMLHSKIIALQELLQRHNSATILRWTRNRKERWLAIAFHDREGGNVNVPGICNTENIAPQELLQRGNSATLQKIMKKDTVANIPGCKIPRNRVYQRAIDGRQDAVNQMHTPGLPRLGFSTY